jgi:predicted NACHT family NTPase
MSEPGWREVFLLASGMLENADTLMQLMQQHSDRLMAVDDKLQQFLVWLHQKSLSVTAPYKSAAIRAFYLTLDLSSELTLARHLSLAHAIDLRLADNLAPDLALDLALNRTLSLSLRILDDPSLDRILALSFAFPQDRVLVYHPKLQRSLQELKEQLPAPAQGREKLKKWWNANGQTWVEKLKSQIIWCRNVGYQWQFNERQKEVLQQYYAAKRLLVDCLNSGCEVTSTVQEKVEETLLLPMAEINSLSESARSEYLKMGLLQSNLDEPLSSKVYAVKN